MHQQVVSLRPSGPCRGDALLSYVVEPFVLEHDDPLVRSHTHFVEATEMAKALMEFGLSVDVIDFRNRDFVPNKEYNVFIDTRFNFDRLTPHLSDKCIKILHAETAHPLFHNAAEAERLFAIYKRRGVELLPRRWEPPNQAIKSADYVTFYGNATFTLETYRQTNKPLQRLPISATQTYPSCDDKDYEACRKRFLWLGSGGLVHKGLDLVLEAFAQMPDHHLTICGPIRNEPDFEQAFHKELYETPNIETIGWVDTSSTKFREILGNCVGLVFASCSEGQAGSVVQCLHAGLIPIVSHQSGVDVGDFGVELRNNSIHHIQTEVQRLSRLSGDELRERSRSAWEYARRNHTLETFGEAYRKFLSAALEPNRLRQNGHPRSSAP